jgi:hypothetical protein
MSFSSFKPGYTHKIELKSKKCIDYVLKPLKDHVLSRLMVPLHVKTFFSYHCKYGCQQDFCSLCFKALCSIIKLARYLVLEISSFRDM